MSKPNPRQDPLTKIILMAAARGRAILQEREKAARQSQVQTSKVIEPKEKPN